MYTSIIFDFFDVIRTDPYKAWLKQHGIRREGIYDEVSKPLDNGSIDLKTFFGQLHKLSGHPVSTMEHEYNKTLPVHDGMINFLGNLSKNYKLGLLTNAPSKYLRRLLDQHDLEKYFDVIIVSSEVGLIKPTPEAFYHILNKLGSTPEETLFIDDNELNVQAANDLGIKALRYTDFPTLKRDLLKRGIESE